MAGDDDGVERLGRRGGGGQSGVDGADPPDLVAAMVQFIDRRRRRVDLGRGDAWEAEQDLLRPLVSRGRGVTPG